MHKYFIALLPLHLDLYIRPKIAVFAQICLCSLSMEGLYWVFVTNVQQMMTDL